MKCPKCNVTLTMSERQGVEIDYCPECRGVWLDRGELDKIIDKSAAPAGDSFNRPSGHQDTYRHYENQKHYRPKKRDSFLGDLFDF